MHQAEGLTDVASVLTTAPAPTRDGCLVIESPAADGGGKD